MSKKEKKKSGKKRKKIPGIQVTSVPNQLRKARDYPINQCYISEHWQSNGICNVLLAREKPDSSFILGGYLVDLYCLGLKNTFYNINVSQADIIDLVKGGMSETFIEIETDFAHSVIYGGIDYAERLGFAPHSDFKYTKYILEPREDINFNNDIEFGRNGKPFYVRGPGDSTAKINSIISQLDQKLGKDNYDYMIS